MSDLSDVEAALVTLVAGALFPGSAYQAGTYRPSGGISTTVYRGWPTDTVLYQDLTAGKAHVSIFSNPNMTRNVSRWQADPVQVSNTPPTITAVAAGVAVTISGTITAGNVVGVLCGSPPVAYAYRAAATDVLADVAAALAGKCGGTSFGAVLTLPSPLNVAAAVMNPQSVMTVTRQQEQGVRITVWAPSPGARDALSSAIDGGLAGLKNAGGFQTRFFSVGAQESARLVYRSTGADDMPSRDRVWRRDLSYTVEYCTTLLEQAPLLLFAGSDFWKQGALSQSGVLQPSVSVLTSADGLSVFVDAAGNIIGTQPVI